MASINRFALFFLLTGSLAACTNPSANNTDQPTSSTTSADTTTDRSAQAVQTLRAKFVEFSLGDAPHFLFETESGEQLDFSDCEDETIEFGRELPADQADETNQGWGSNTELQNKWFDLKYIARQEPLYPDGPIGDVFIITEAKLAAN